MHMRAQARITFRCLSFLLPVGKYLLTQLIFIVHRKTCVSIKVQIASTGKWRLQHIAASWLLPSPESSTCTLEEITVLRPQMALLRKD